MKVIFVCYANVARSQVAEEYFRQLTENFYEFTACSAGVGVDELVSQCISNKVIDSPYHRSIDYIKEELHVDISNKERLQFSIELYNTADLVIMICDKSLWPEYIEDVNIINKVRHWDIPDTPGLDDSMAWTIWNIVCNEVEKLVKEIA